MRLEFNEPLSSCLKSAKPKGVLEPIADALAPPTIDEASAVQHALNTRLASMLGPVAGYKSELTTAVMQQILGLNVLGNLQK